MDLPRRVARRWVVKGDYLVTVCDACLQSSCWLGIFHCHADRPGIREMRASELRKLDREHADYYSRETILRHTGSLPKEVS
jgi:hypothetical protein